MLLVMAVAPYLVSEFTENTQPQADDENRQSWEPSPPVPTADAAPVWKPETAQSQSPASAKSAISAGISGSTTLPTSTNVTSTDMPLSSKLNTEPAGSRQSSPWPREMEEKAEFSPWPNPAHPIVVQSEPGKNTESPAGVQPYSGSVASGTVFTNRPMALGEAPPVRMANSPVNRPFEQKDYQAAVEWGSRPNQPYTADRRNITLPGGFVRLPPPQAINASGAIQPGSPNESSGVQFEGVIETPSERNAYERFRPSIH